jgi:hypothetical protein
MVQATKTRTIEIEVNTRPVTLPDEPSRDEATGAQIKAAAIAQGINIRSDFPLFRKHGNDLDPVADDQVVHVRRHDKFLAVAPDDNS